MRVLAFEKENALSEPSTDASPATTLFRRMSTRKRLFTAFSDPQKMRKMGLER